MSDPLPNDPFWCLHPASRLEPEETAWLWQWRLALGSLAILDGDPGLGKSFLALDLCARLSTGRPMPDGTPGPGVLPSVVLNAEDSRPETQRRLRALGADADRVHLLQPVPGAPWQLPRFPTHAGPLGRVLAETGARLVVIDPVTAFLDPGVNTNNDPSVRRAILPLAQLAERFRCLILLIRHLNKERSFRALYRGGGSIGIVGTCRSAWLVGPDPVRTGRNVLAQVKNNLAGPQPSLAYELVAREGVLAGVNWQGPVRWAANQLLVAAADIPGKLTPRVRAREFLSAALADGPRTSRELWPIAQEQRLSPKTLRRAKEDMQIRSQRAWADGKRLSYWLLPGQELPAGVTAEEDPNSLEPWLAPLREMFPPRTPLDDM